MKLNGLVYFSLAVLVVMSGVIGWQAHKTVVRPEILASAGLIQSLQDSVKVARAELRSSGAMVATLRQAGQARDGKLKVAAATIADLTAKLGRIEGGGEARPDTGGWSVYQDKYLTAFFKQSPDTGYLSYSLAARPLKISLVEDLTNTWSAYAWDVLDNVPVPVESLEIQRNRDWTPPRPWYKKLATVAKYTGIALVSGSLGYVAGKVF